MRTKRLNQSMIGHQIHEALRHRHIGNIRRPDLIGSSDLHIPQQIGIFLVLRVRDGRARAWIHRLQPHRPHQAQHPFGIDGVALLLEPDGQLAIAVERRAGVFRVNQPHQFQIQRRLAGGLPVEARPAQPQQRHIAGAG